jgi:hypothetical protein
LAEKGGFGEGWVCVCKCVCKCACVRACVRACVCVSVWTSGRRQGAVPHSARGAGVVGSHRLPYVPGVGQLIQQAQAQGTLV